MSRIEPVDPRVRLAIAQWPPDAPRGAVTTFCAEHSISRKTFHAIRKRALVEGQAAALEPRSRRPKSSPTKITAEVRQQAVAVRTALESSGLDCGPISVHDKMAAPVLSREWIADLAASANSSGGIAMIAEYFDGEDPPVADNSPQVVEIVSPAPSGHP